MRNITMKHEARVSLAEGARILAEAVGSTLGPHGKNVTVWLGHGVPMTTKDGASIAREVKLSDPVEAAGAELVKAAAKKSAEEAGDGTTTATILANAFIEEGMRAIENGMSIRELRAELEDGLSVSSSMLTEMKKEVSSVTDVIHVASISANDPVIGERIGNALYEVGADGLATVELGLESGITVERVDGYRFDKGWISPVFVDDQSKLRTVLTDVAIYLSPDVVTSGEEVVRLFQAAADAKKKALLLVVGGLEGQALATAILNKKEGRMAVLPVKAPAFGERRLELLGDMAAVTGAIVHVREDETEWSLGFAAKVESDRMGTCIFGGNGSDKEKKERLASIATLRKSTKSAFDRQELDRRRESLDGKAVLFSVGGQSETEALELFHRVEDAVLASKAAMRSGILPGAGRALLEVNRKTLSAYPVFAMALVSPFWKLMENAQPDSLNGFNIMEAFTDNVWTGLAWSGKTREFKMLDLYAAGIIDPFQVTMSALRNAVSVAMLVLSTETVITEKPS